MDYQECGYDVSFVSDTPEYLRCSVCHFVLRDPVFVISCGHKFCKPCYERMRMHAGTSALLCPIDRNVIDMTKVCDESGLCRVIGCLVVKCGSHDAGCTWEGQLSDLSVHEEHCQYSIGQVVHQQQPDNSELIRMVKELQSRMDRYEECLEKKDKELAHVKMKWQDEVDELKQNEVRTSNMLGVLQQNEVRATKLLEDLQQNEIQTSKLLGDLQRENAEMKIQFNDLNMLKENEIQRKKLVDELIVENTAMKKRQENLEKKLKQETSSSQPASNAQSNVLWRFFTGTITQNPTKLPRGSVQSQLFNVYVGNDANVPVISDNHLSFGKEITVLGVPSAFVSLGDKVYFEVTCTEKWQGGHCGFGWAPSEFKSSNRNKVDLIKNVHDGIKWFLPFYQTCYEDGVNVSLYCQPHYHNYFGPTSSDLRSEFIMGVAADMTKGQLLYSFNGNWDKPMGVAFKNLSKTTQYFPVLAGSNITLIVNFGDTDFKHAPPDQSYKKCNQLFL